MACVSIMVDFFKFYTTFNYIYRFKCLYILFCYRLAYNTDQLLITRPHHPEFKHKSVGLLSIDYSGMISNRRYPFILRRA